MLLEAGILTSNATKIHVIPMGVDTTMLFTPDTAVRRHCQSLLFVGRLIKGKGVIVLIQALQRVLPKYPKITLHIVGYGPEEFALKEYAQKYGMANNIQFLGAIANSDLPDLYRKATIFISPSLSEGFGLTLAEALACECPVVTTDIPAIRDLIIDGKTGTTVPTNDPEKLAEKILFLLANPELRQRLAVHGRNHVRQQYDWARTTERYRDLIDSLLA